MDAHLNIDFFYALKGGETLKELIQEMTIAVLGLALAFIVYQISQVGVTGLTNDIFTYATSAFKVITK